MELPNLELSPSPDPEKMSPKDTAIDRQTEDNKQSQRQPRARQKETLEDLKDMIWSLGADIQDMKQKGDSGTRDLYKTQNQLQDTTQETQKMTSALVRAVSKIQASLDKAHQDIASDKKGTEHIWLRKGKTSMAHHAPRRAHPPALSVMPLYQNIPFKSFDPTLFTPISTPLSVKNPDPSTLGTHMPFLPNTKAVANINHLDGKAN
ncbi:hypothetical protein EYZ11_013237 [Aspergillus tanneri]|uniref:Uncharacterized protein n=1 Tax=Aspergillus tanneri TaxID=1220188 RepID=A0A4S3IY60_9EURO|nr:hypothetical protein EYZ11_013237 [Aspergillus tanneri]